MRLKNRTLSFPPQVHLEPILNLHSKLQHPTSIRREVMKGKISKNKKNQPKNYIFGPVRGCNEAETSKLPKSTFIVCTESICQISTS